MRVLIALTTCVVTSLFPQFCFADSGLIVKESLWRLIAEEDQVAVIKLDKNGTVDVSLFISIVDKSGQPNIVHLVLPFRDKPLSLRAEELMLADFRRMHVEAIESRLRQLQQTYWSSWRRIENGFRFAIALGCPLGLLMAEVFRPPTPSALPPGLQLGGVKAIAPEIVVTTEHTRTEVYRIERPADIEQLLRDTRVSQKQLERLKRQLVGRYLYLVTVKTVPLSSSQQPSHPSSQPYSRPISEEERLGVVFHVQLEAQRNSNELTFTYPLGTGETWWRPISLTELFILTPLDGSVEIRYPRPANQSRPSLVNPRESWQKTFVGRDEIGHIVRLTYGNANPSEDVTVKFDPTKRSNIPTTKTVERVGKVSWLLFLALLAILWLPSLWLFVSLSSDRTLSVSSFLWEALGVGFLWAVFNGFFGLMAWAFLKEVPLAIRIYRLWLLEEVELWLLFLLILVLTTLIAFALLPSMRPYRAKLLGIVLGVPLVLLTAFFPPAVAVLLALPVGSLVIYFWLKRENERSPTYWQCLTFSLIFGIVFVVVSLLVKNTLLALVQ